MKYLVILLFLVTIGVEAQSPLAGALGVKIKKKIREKIREKIKERCDMDENVCPDGQTLEPRKAIDDDCDGYLNSEIPAPSPPFNTDAECEPKTVKICLLCLNNKKIVQSAHPYEIEIGCTNECRSGGPFRPIRTSCPDLKNAVCTKA